MAPIEGMDDADTGTVGIVVDDGPARAALDAVEAIIGEIPRWQRNLVGAMYARGRHPPTADEQVMAMRAAERRRRRARVESLATMLDTQPRDLP